MRIQEGIEGMSDAVQRIHAIPFEIKEACSRQRTSEVKKLGRQNAPTLADIYFAKAKAGLAIAAKQNGFKAIKEAIPTSKEVGFSCRIFFDTDTNAVVKAMQVRLKEEAGIEASLTAIVTAAIAVALKAS